MLKQVQHDGIAHLYFCNSIELLSQRRLKEGSREQCLQRQEINKFKIES